MRKPGVEYVGVDDGVAAIEVVEPLADGFEEGSLGHMHVLLRYVRKVG